MNWNSTFQTPQPPPSKPKVILTQEEQPYYQQLYFQLDPNNQGTVNGKDSVQFFKRSGLPVDVLKSIWILVSSGGSTLEQDEFMNALRLIAYAQNGLEVSEKSIQQNIPVALPKFGFDDKPQSINSQIMAKLQTQNTTPRAIQSNPDSRLELPLDVFNKYNSYYSSIDTEQRGHVKGFEAKSLFSKSQLSNEILKRIWHLCDSNNKGYLFQGEFIIAIHLIALAKRGIEIPQTLPDSLMNIMIQNRVLISSLNLKPKSQTQPLASPTLQQKQSTLFQFTSQQDQIEEQIPEQKQQEQIQQKIQSLNIQQSQVRKQSSTIEFEKALSTANDLLKSCVEEKSKDIDFFANFMRNQETLIIEAQEQTLKLKNQIQQLDTQKKDQIGQIQKLQQQLQEQLLVNQQLLQQLQQQVSQPPVIAQIPEPLHQRPVSQPVGFQNQIEIPNNHPKSFHETQQYQSPLNLQNYPPLDVINQDFPEIQTQNKQQSSDLPW